MSEASIHLVDQAEGKFTMELRLDGRRPLPGDRLDDLSISQQAALLIFAHFKDLGKAAFDRVEYTDGTAELHA